MLWKSLILVVVCTVGIASAQKLFFKSNKWIQKEVEELNKDQRDSVLGFGFGKRRKYFTAVKQLPKQVKDFGIKCPDNRTTCPDGNTCCQVSLTAYGCCPLQKATCCVDKKHCCPFGTKCDFGRKACISEEVVIPWFEHTSVDDPVTVDAVICPDGEHQCNDGQTCCKSAESYSCCPLPKAVCCADQIHCCPINTTCDTAHSRCIHSNGLYVPMLKKHSPMKENKGIEDVHSVPCDDKHACPTANTCCLLDSGSWGCCPKPSAVCCSDHLHCCPQGTKCDNTSRSCVDDAETTPWSTKTPAISTKSIQCDDTHECPSENTCCKLASGQWGCCPLPNAVCCSDGIHCCPSGTTCDAGQGKCNKGDTQVDWFIKQPARGVSVVHCDSTHTCPSGNTCCKLASGQWGCCPLPEAVCCSDGIHCCPSGTTCDAGEGKCNKGDTQVDWFIKQPARDVSSVKCDGTHECPSENTCCKLASGQWGCCPFPHAVSCDDHIHCCPNGMTCDITEGKCNRENIQLNWLNVELSGISVRDVICADGSECQDGQTCCKMNDAYSYGCCPLPNAVCCDDGQHCCPHSFRCNLASGMCERGLMKLQWTDASVLNTRSSSHDASIILNSTVKVLVVNEGIKDVTCSDEKTCPDQYTCCKNGQEGYNCCPLPNGVCCSDNQHCCPSGYICDEEPGICRIPELTSALSNFIKNFGSKKAVPHT